jgi:hypothetical protein
MKQESDNLYDLPYGGANITLTQIKSWVSVVETLEEASKVIDPDILIIETIKVILTIWISSKDSYRDMDKNALAIVSQLHVFNQEEDYNSPTAKASLRLALELLTTHIQAFAD